MALITPVLNAIPAWDVGNGRTFTFVVPEGEGDVVTGNILTVLNNSTSAVAYRKQTTSYQYSISVPPNASGLQNGVYYSAYVQTLNADGGISEASNTIQFYCYTTPSWTLDIASGSMIDSSSINPHIHYLQTEGELLYSYTFTLYDNSQTQIATSGIQYVTSSSSDVQFNYEFDGLENNTAYYIRVTGTTIENTSLDTGYIRFTISFTQLEQYDAIYAEVNCDEGYITYYSLAAKIDGYYSGEPQQPQFVDGSINLKNAEVTWINDGIHSAFDIKNNFVMKILFYNGIYDSKGLGFINYDDFRFVLNCIKDINNPSQIIGTLTIYDVDYNEDSEAKNGHFIFSEPIEKPAINEKVLLQIKRINNLYDIKLEKYV